MRTCVDWSWDEGAVIDVWVADDQTSGRLATRVAVWVTSRKVLVVLSWVYVAPVCVWPSTSVTSSGSYGGVVFTDIEVRYTIRLVPQALKDSVAGRRI